MADARKFDHVTPLLVNLHWLRVPQRIQYKLCIPVHRCLNGAAPQYLSQLIQPLLDVDSCHRLPSASMAEILVPAMQCTTIGLEQSSSKSSPIPDIFYFQNTPEVTSVQHILPFSLTVSLTIFCTQPLKPLVLHTPH